jgi:hypothetical protein
LTRNAIKTRLVPSRSLEIALYFEVGTEERSYKSGSSDRRQQQRRWGRAITIRSRSNKERSGSTEAQMGRLVAIYITPKRAITVIKQMRRTTRMMKTRG